MSPRQRAANTRNQTPALLRGLIFGPTGTAMTPTTAKRGSRIYRYYVSMDVIRNRDSDPATGPQRLASCAAAYVARVTFAGLDHFPFTHITLISIGVILNAPTVGRDLSSSSSPKQVGGAPPTMELFPLYPR